MTLARSLSWTAFALAALGAASPAAAGFGAKGAAAGAESKAAAQAGKPAAVPGVAASTKTATFSTVEEMYPAFRLRNPFAPVMGAGSASPAAVEMPPDEFSIHGLELKGIMEDRFGGYALLRDTKYGVRFVLRRGKLLDAKNKPVPGVTGWVRVKQKTVRLVTAEKEVQVLTLGEPEDRQGKDAKDTP